MALNAVSPLAEAKQGEAIRKETHSRSCQLLGLFRRWGDIFVFLSKASTDSLNITMIRRRVKLYRSHFL
jgi:hypothetical protein